MNFIFYGYLGVFSIFFIWFMRLCVKCLSSYGEVVIDIWFKLKKNIKLNLKFELVNLIV